MVRACFTIVVVAALSVGINWLRDSQSQGATPADTQQIAWVRTVDGWEPSWVLLPKTRPAGAPALHPGLVATLQLGISLFALLALPTTNVVRRKC